MGTKLSNPRGKGCSSSLCLLKNVPAKNLGCRQPFPILLDGRPPAHKLVIPLPLGLDIAMGGLTSSVPSVAGQRGVPATKLLLLLGHIWLSSRSGQEGRLSEEITDLFWSQRKRCGMCGPYRIGEFERWKESAVQPTHCPGKESEARGG